MTHAVPAVDDDGNPDQVRVSGDGRSAVRFLDPDGQPRWLRVFAPAGQLQVALLEDDEVADWTEVWRA